MLGGTVVYKVVGIKIMYFHQIQVYIKHFHLRRKFIIDWF